MCEEGRAHSQHTAFVCTTSFKVRFIHVSHCTRWPLRVSPFLSSTSIGWPCAALRRPRGSCGGRKRETLVGVRADTNEGRDRVPWCPRSPRKRRRSLVKRWEVGGEGSVVEVLFAEETSQIRDSPKAQCYWETGQGRPASVHAGRHAWAARNVALAAL